MYFKAQDDGTLQRNWKPEDLTWPQTSTLRRVDQILGELARHEFGNITAGRLLSIRREVRCVLNGIVTEEGKVKPDAYCKMIPERFVDKDGNVKGYEELPETQAIYDATTNKLAEERANSGVTT